MSNPLWQDWGVKIEDRRLRIEDSEGGRRGETACRRVGEGKNIQHPTCFVKLMHPPAKTSPHPALSPSEGAREKTRASLVGWHAAHGRIIFSESTPDIQSAWKTTIWPTENAAKEAKRRQNEEKFIAYCRVLSPFVAFSGGWGGVV